MVGMRGTLAVGDFGRNALDGLRAVSEGTGLELNVVGSSFEALEWMTQHEPHSLLLKSGGKEVEQTCFEVRAQLRHALVPIVALASKVDELAFAEVFSWGGDDVVCLGEWDKLITRLRRLPKAAWERKPDSQQRVALIAATERSRRIVLARVLGNAGYAIQFAVTLEDAALLAEKSPPRVVVIDADLDGAMSLVREQAPAHPQTLWIITAPPRRIRECKSKLEDLPNAALIDGYAPPENVVFLANELGGGRGVDKRASRRLLYGTLVRFRSAGRDSDDLGLSYNISSGGIYVRSLAPPIEDCVWLELTPPRTERRVRLEGMVAWRRGYGPSDTATVPPGFGVKITDASRADIKAWEDGYHSLAALLGESNSLRPAR
jgi:DNA-binding response OmpR family regulator